MRDRIKDEVERIKGFQKPCLILKKKLMSKMSIYETMLNTYIRTGKEVEKREIIDVLRVRFF